MIRWLAETTRNDVSSAGGKGANLGEMTRLGLPVPRGFCITAGAYTRQVGAWGLRERLAPLLTAQDWGAAHAAARAVCAGSPLDPELERAVREAYRSLGTPGAAGPAAPAPVAVRSSATAEDLADASFAGQQETFLKVTGEADLLAAVRACWASLWAPRALHYRHQRSIDHLETAIAVVVQEMVPADAAGVLFTVDPVAQRLDRMLVEAAPGLGEAVVSGQVTGDSYRVDRSGPVRLAERVVRLPGRTVLSEQQVLDLAGLGLRLEAHYGAPQDVEFAVAGGRLYLLQTRPITTLAAVRPEPIPPVPRPSMMQRRAAQLASDRYPLAPKPLDNLCMQVLLGATAHALRFAGFAVSAEAEAACVKQLWRAAYVGPQARPTLKLLRTAKLVAELLDRDWAAWWASTHGPALSAVCAGPTDLSHLTDAELLSLADEVHAVWFRAFKERFEVITAYFAEDWLRTLVGLAVGRRRRVPVMLDLMGGLETRTTETNRALWDLSRAARRAPAVAEALRAGKFAALGEQEGGAEFMAEVATFLERYGHRAGAAWYISVPTWRQQPVHVLQMLRGLIAVDEAPPDTGAERYAAARALVEARLARIPFLLRHFRWLLERFRLLQVFRENSNFDLVRPLSALQAAAAEWGRRLTERGHLTAPDDVFYLIYDEVRRWLTGGAPEPAEARELIARRRVTWTEANSRWQARLFRSGGAGDTLKGVGASPGTVRARARRIECEAQFDRLQPGEVLVCPYTNPSWTPLFAAAAAVVTETGGAMSHAAIVAREYGIPAVMGVTGVLSRVGDGQELLVNGTTGEVLLASP